MTSWQVKEPRTIFLLKKEGPDYFVLMNTEERQVMNGSERCWLISDTSPAVELISTGEMIVTSDKDGIIVDFTSDFQEIIHPHRRPRCDIFGNGYQLLIPNGEVFEKTLAYFYWDTILPSVIERSRGVDYPDWRGYVVSTLKEGEYAGTYPDVDHEFQCKGRLALSGDFELGIVQRMMELQFRLMQEDPAGLWRNPCAVQPDGTREYHVRRNSMDGTVNAEMFLVTGNVEILETAWLYVARTKNEEWLAANISNLEGAASLLSQLTDDQGRLWSDVFYEDQVMKDGMECMSAALAAHALRLLSELELQLDRLPQAANYRRLAEKLEACLIEPAPSGFWDDRHQRFIDWIDRNGKAHDHTHLLANILPVLFDTASKEQAAAVQQIVEESKDAFQRFPTFLSPFIEDYTEDELGDGGPYDLCAAGRYWCWDAAYWAKLGDGTMLQQQLLKVAEQAVEDNYRMGERYDMNHVYYVDEKNWHGAPHYYEYPNVFSWVLIHEYLGIGYSLDYDLTITPLLTEFGSIQLASYGLSYAYTADGFMLRNDTHQSKVYYVDLSKLTHPQQTPEVVYLRAGETCIL